MASVARRWRVFLSRLVALGAFLMPGRAAPASGPSPEKGRPVIQNFLPRDYEAHNQVFTLAEAPSGLFYFAVYGNVLEFDGRTWRKIGVPTSWIRGLAAAPDGAIYVGATDQFGVCRPGSDGLMAFESFVARLPDRVKPLGPIWSTVWHDGAVWFSASHFVARCSGQETQVWDFPAAPRAIVHSIGRELLLRRVGDALYRWTGERFEPVSSEPDLIGATFASFVEDRPDGILALTERGHMFRLRNGQLQRAELPLAGHIVRLGMRGLLRRRDGSLAVATVSSGVLLADAAGNVRERITDASHGLVNDVGYVLHEDKSGGVWLTTYGGISRLELGSGLTLFDQRNGRGPTSTFAMVRWRGKYHLGSIDGLYRLDDATPDTPARLTQVTPPSVWSSSVVVHDHHLFVTGAGGLVRLREDATPELVFPAPVSAAALIPSASDRTRLFFSTAQGIHVLRLEDGRVASEAIIPGHTAETQSMFEEPDGTLWLGTTQGGYVRARRRTPQSTWQQVELTAFAPGTRGVPADPGWCRVVAGPDGAPLFSTGRGALVADAARENLVPAPPFVEAGIAGLYSHPLLTADADTIYAQVGSAEALDQLTLGRLVRREGKWTWQPLPKAATEVAGYLGAYHLHHERSAETGEDILWVSGRDALVRLDLRTAMALSQPAPVAQIRSVAQRTVGRWGAAAGNNGQPLRLDYSREPLEFTFAAARYDAAAKIAFQTRLAGYADAWSEWSPRGELSFTNLSGGPFVFEVRARDGDGRIGPAARFAFAVSPPWHRSAPAMAVYAAALGAAVYGFVRHRLRRAERERARLEKLVAQRTEELRLAKNAAD